MRYLRIATAIMLGALVGGCAGTTPAPSPSAAAVDVTGTWRGSYQSLGVVPVGDFTLVLLQTGNKVTGTQTPPGAELEGSVSGNTVSYRLTSGRGGTGELTVNGNDMTGYSTAGSRLTLKRAQ